MTRTKATTPARQRLLDAATELFYREGIPGTGVDKVAAHSGVSKPSLYAHFGSKEELVHAYLAARYEHRRATLEADLRGRASDPVGQILAAFDWLEELCRAPDFRGCAFINAAVEVGAVTPRARELTEAYKTWVRGLLERLAEEAGLRAPAELARALMLLIDGVLVTALIEGRPDSVAAARHAGTVLIDAHRPNTRGSAKRKTRRPSMD